MCVSLAITIPIIIMYRRMLKQIYSFRLYNDAEVRRVIGDVNATDKDRGQFGLIEYAISNDVDRYFDIDPVTVRVC